MPRKVFRPSLPITFEASHFAIYCTSWAEPRMEMLCLVKDACLERSAISKTERKRHRGQTLLTIPSTKRDRSLFFSLFNPDVSKLQSVCVEVPVYKHASGHRVCWPNHVFTTACLEIQHALPHASVWPLPLQVRVRLLLGFEASMHVQILESCLYNSIWWCKNDKFHLAGNTTGVLSHLLCLIDNITPLKCLRYVPK